MAKSRRGDEKHSTLALIKTWKENAKILYPTDDNMHKLLHIKM